MPSSGGVASCKILNVLEGYNLKSMGFNSAPAIHTMTEVMRYAYMDRNTCLGKLECIKNRIDRLTSKRYAAEMRKKIIANKVTPCKNVLLRMAIHEKPATTYY